VPIEGRRGKCQPPVFMKNQGCGPSYHYYFQVVVIKALLASIFKKPPLPADIFYAVVEFEIHG